MKAGNAFRSVGLAVLGALCMVAADRAVLAQRAAGHAAGHAAPGRAGTPIGRPGAGYGGPRGYGGYGGRGYGRGGRWGWGAGWGWGPGWGWLPLGIYLSALPWYYSTYWWDGIPYYYADNNYYLWNGTGYERVQPPADFSPPAQPPGGAPDLGELFAYPKNGQSAAQQATDKSECRTWAAGQSGHDVTVNSTIQHQDYLRAEAACLEARGYVAR